MEKETRTLRDNVNHPVPYSCRERMFTGSHTGCHTMLAYPDSLWEHMNNGTLMTLSVDF